MIRITKKRIIVAAIVAAIVASIVPLALWLAYPTMERNYQMAMDPIRKKHALQIVSLIQEFADKTGHLPYQEQATDKPFMVLIGHSAKEEDYFANDPVLKRDATWTNSAELEAMLSNGLERPVRLPRDPQKVPTYAPNVYVYFVTGNQMTVVAHLKYPSEEAVEYDWYGKPFYAYSPCYDFKPKAEVQRGQ